MPRIFLIPVAVALLSCLSIARAANMNATDMAQRLAPCAACHGEAGRSSQEEYYPSIAGKPAGYLYEQLLNFRDGRRQQADMQRMLAWLSDDYLRAMADYFASRKAAVMSLGERLGSQADGVAGESLVLRGNASRNLPACTACHGEGLTGRGEYIPGLLGLRAEYIEAQLGGWQVGSRSARTPDCMKSIADRLSGPEMAAVARWIATQPVSGIPAAEPASEQPLPLDCGAVQRRP